MSDISKLSDGTNTYNLKDANAVHTSDVTSTYSPSGTDPVNGTAVASAISGMSIAISVQNTALTPSSGICTWTITASKSPTCSCLVYETSTGNRVFPDITYGDGIITVKINSTSNISANTYTAVIIG